MVSMKSFWSRVRRSRGVASALSYSLMLNFMRPTREKSYLARSKKHALEKLGRGVERGRVAGPQLAVDLQQRLGLGSDAVLLERGRDHVAHVVALGKKISKAGISASISRAISVGVSSWLASISTSPVDMSTTSAAAKAPSRSLGATSTCSTLAFAISLKTPCVILRPLRHHRVAALGVMA